MATPCFHLFLCFTSDTWQMIAFLSDITAHPFWTVEAISEDNFFILKQRLLKTKLILGFHFADKAFPAKARKFIYKHDGMGLTGLLVIWKKTSGSQIGQFSKRVTNFNLELYSTYRGFWKTLHRYSSTCSHLPFGIEREWLQSINMCHNCLRKDLHLGE